MPPARSRELRAGAPSSRPGAAERQALRLLQAATSTSAFDRFAVTGLLVVVAADLRVPLAGTVGAASAYFLTYGLAQPAWGLVSDRLGRVRTLRLALSLAAVGAAASALAPALPWLVLARALTGACTAAVVPSVLVYVGDVVPYERRQTVLTDVNAATAVGLTLGTALGGLLAAAVGWRLVFLLPGLLAAVLVVVLRSVPEPARSAMLPGGLRAVLRHRWARRVLALALVEGAVLLGLLVYLAPALQDRGTRPALAGAVVSLYGVGLLGASRVVKRLAARTTPPVLLLGGSACLVAAYSLVCVSRSAWVVGAAALLVGAAWAAVHSTMQTWATEVVASARAAMVSSFAAALFVGSGLASLALAPWADQSRWPLVFGLAAGAAAAFGPAAAAGRRRWATVPDRA